MNEEEKLLNQKRKRINEIQINFNKLEELFKTEKAKHLFDSIGLFNYEEYSKFFQNLANKEHTTMSEHHKKSIEPITIDKKQMKFSPFVPPQNLDETLPQTKTLIKNNLEPKGIPKRVKENLNKISQEKSIGVEMSLYFQSVSENITNLLNSRSKLEPEHFKQLIKIYSNLIRIGDDLCKPEDELILSLLKKFLFHSFPNFFELSSFWLYTEYLLSSKNNEFKRYDSILNNIIKIINNQNETIDYAFNYNIFINNVPKYNKSFIDNVINFHKAYLDRKSEEIDKKILSKISSNNKINIYEILPYLENMKGIYINIIFNRNLLDINDKDKEKFKKDLLDSFLLITKNQNKYLNAKAIQFIFNDIYFISKNLDQYEEKIIKQYAIHGLEEIKNNNIISINNIENNKLDEEKKLFTEKRFQLYLNLCVINTESILKLPEVYSEVSQPIKNYMNGLLSRVLSRIDQVNAEELIGKCTEQSEDIVIEVIKAIYGKTDYHCDTKIEEEKLFRNIKAYYVKYCPNLTKGVIEYSNKIPINDFFTNYNFILNKIQQYSSDTSEEGITNKILNQLNSPKINKNNNCNNIKNIYSRYDYINNKIFFYILYHSQKKNKDEYLFHKDLMVKYHLKLLIKLKKENEIIFQNEINNINAQLQSENVLNNFPLENIFNLYDAYKREVKNVSELVNEKTENILEFLGKILIGLINAKCLDSQNIKSLEEYYKKLNNEEKGLFKEKIIKNISEQIKGSLDLILFGDIY